MSIRPIDLQMVVHKSTDIGKNVNHENNNPSVAQQSFAQNLQKEVRQTSEQVNNTNKSEQNSIDQNSSGQNKYMSGKRKRKKNSGSDNEKRKAGSTSLFDVTI